MLRGHLSIAEKDMAWVLSLARQNEVSLPVGALVSQLMKQIYAVEDEGGVELPEGGIRFAPAAYSSPAAFTSR